MASVARLPDVAMIALRVRERGGLPAIGCSADHGGDQIVAIGPDEWLAIAPDGDAAALGNRLAPLGGVRVDVSGNRVTLRVAGADTRDLLAGGCALDLEAMRPGDAVSTLLARAQVVLIAEAGGAFLILPRRSLAGYVLAWAEAAGGQRG